MLTTLKQAMHLVGRDQRARWVLLVALALVTSVFEMLGAILVYVLIALVADPDGQIDLPIVGDLRAYVGDVDDSRLLLGVVVVMAVFFLLRGLLQIGAVYAQRRVAYNSGARLSNKLVMGYLASPYSVHLLRNSAELIRNGHQAVQQLVNQVFLPVIRVTAEFFLVTGMLVLLVTVTPIGTAIAVVVVGGTAAVLLLVVQPRLKQLGRTTHQTQRQTLESLQQSLHGIRDIKVLGRERFFAERYGRSRLRLARAQYLRSTILELPSTVMELAFIGFILAFFSITLIADQRTQAALSVLGLFAYAGLRLQPSLQRIISGLNDIKYSAAPLEDLHADLLAVEALPKVVDSTPPLRFEKAIILEDVGFRYDQGERNALLQINLIIRHGEEIGICGPTGGGKTTLVDIITGLLVPTTGRVLVDGNDVLEHTREWQRNLGVVPQMVFLLDDSLRRNVALGVPDGQVDEEALAEAIELAQLTDFVGSLAKGLDTTVGERGVRISGGQRQRIAIARALYRRPTVLIFDEGTSALDNATEAELMASVDELRGRHTIILIAHRLSTVRKSDRVIFVDQGRIAGEGSYDQLMNEHEAFRAMAGAPP